MNKFNISDLSIEEVNLLMSGLLELPGKFTLNLIAKLRTQLDSQGIRSGQEPAGETPQEPSSDRVVN